MSLIVRPPVLRQFKSGMISKLVLALTALITVAALAYDVMHTAWLDRRLALARQYELKSPSTPIDIDGDGIPGQFTVTGVQGPHARPAVLVDGGRELLRVSYTDLGDGFRTCIGARMIRGSTRVYVFDGIRGVSHFVRDVYRFDGSALVASPPDPDDEAMLDVLSANSMYGYGFNVAAYEVTRRDIGELLLFANAGALVWVLAAWYVRRKAA